MKKTLNFDCEADLKDFDSALLVLLENKKDELRITPISEREFVIDEIALAMAGMFVGDLSVYELAYEKANEIIKSRSFFGWTLKLIDGGA